MFQSYKKRLSQWLLSCIMVLAAAEIYAAQVQDIRLWRAPDYTRVVLDLSGSVEHNIIVLKNPNRIVIDIEKASSKVDVSKLDLQKSPISRVRTGVKDKTDLRLVLDVKSAVNPRSFLLKANQKAGDRLVISVPVSLWTTRSMKVQIR